MPALMAVVLLAGIGIGVGVGVGLAPDKPEPQAAIAWEESELAVDRPLALDEQDTVAEEDQASSLPIVPLPLPRPGSADDESTDYAASEGEETPAPAVAAAIQAAPQPPEQQEAATPVVVPPPAAPVPPGAPAWVRYAVPAPKIAGRPMIAVVIDDMGVDRRRSEKVIPLRAPLTLAWMTYAHDLPRLTREARGRGHELLVHVPMQPQSNSWNPGPDVLEVGVSPEENRRRLNWGLSRFEGFVGINNHMGSRFTGDRIGMKVVMEELKKRGLLFLDSLTTEKSVGAELARSHGVPFVARNVFIDNQQDVGAILVQLHKAEAYARKHGSAIAIGHPHDTTIAALSQWLPTLEAKGLVLVPVSAIVRARQGKGG